MRCLLVLLMFVAFALSPAGFCAEAPIVEGSTAPNWILAGSDGEPVSLYQQAEAGNTTVMVFFASWCRNCKILLPFLSQYQSALADKPYRIYLLNVWDDPEPQVVEDIQQTGIPLLLRAENVARRFQIDTTPGVVVVGPDKKIIYKRPSGTSVDDTAAMLATLLNLD